MNKKERNDLIISWLTISFAFAWIGTGILSQTGIEKFITNFLILLVAVGTGFIFHELAHKYVAIHYGANAEFRAWRQGLLLAIGLAIFTNGTFVFAAPGAVYVYGKNITIKQNGIISLAGPLMNITVVILFGLLFSIFSNAEFLARLFVQAMYVNFFLAAFNLLPIYPLDGSKVFTWNKTAWVITMLIAVSGVLFFNYWLAIFLMLGL